MIYSVQKYNESLMHHTLISLDGNYLNVDLFVDDSFNGLPDGITNYSPEQVTSFMKSLVGKKIEIKKLIPIIYAGQEVSIID